MTDEDINKAALSIATQEMKNDISGPIGETPAQKATRVKELADIYAGYIRKEAAEPSTDQGAGAVATEMPMPGATAGDPFGIDPRANSLFGGT